MTSSTLFVVVNTGHNAKKWRHHSQFTWQHWAFIACEDWVELCDKVETGLQYWKNLRPSETRIYFSNHSFCFKHSATRNKMFAMYSTYPELEQQVNRTDIPDYSVYPDSTIGFVISLCFSANFSPSKCVFSLKGASRLEPLRRQKRRLQREFAFSKNHYLPHKTKKLGIFTS